MLRAPQPPTGALEVIALAAMTAGAGYTVWHWQRGLQDRLAGTPPRTEAALSAAALWARIELVSTAAAWEAAVFEPTQWSMVLAAGRSSACGYTRHRSVGETPCFRDLPYQRRIKPLYAAVQTAESPEVCSPTEHALPHPDGPVSGAGFLHETNRVKRPSVTKSAGFV